MYFQQGRVDEALQELERYVERQPSASEVRTLIGMILEVQNRKADAQKQYERALETDAERPLPPTTSRGCTPSRT